MRTRYSYRHLVPTAAPRAEHYHALHRARLLRALVLLLLVLLLIFVGMMSLTGRYDVGGPVLGSVLLISLGAAHCVR